MPCSTEDVLLLQEAGLDVFRRGHDPRTGQRVDDVPVQKGGHRPDHRRKQNVDLALLAEHQLPVVAGHALHGIAAINGATTAAVVAALLLAGVSGEHDAPRIDAERRQEPEPELVGGPDVEGPRDADAQLRPGPRADRNASARTISPTSGYARLVSARVSVQEARPSGPHTEPFRRVRPASVSVRACSNVTPARCNARTMVAARPCAAAVGNVEPVPKRDRQSRQQKRTFHTSAQAGIGEFTALLRARSDRSRWT